MQTFYIKLLSKEQTISLLPLSRHFYSKKMEPQFPHTPEGFAAQQIYLTFRQHMLHIGCFLPLSSVINFTALSRYFNNALNNPTSDYGRVFWRTWSVKTGNMKAFSTSSINYKFKLVKQKICDMKKVIKSCNLHAWRKSYCKNCNKICQPDRYDDWLFNDRKEFSILA